jgi:hypothetical protein
MWSALDGTHCHGCLLVMVDVSCQDLCFCAVVGVKALLMVPPPYVELILPVSHGDTRVGLLQK